MVTQQETGSGYSGGMLLLAATGSALAGVALGYQMAKRQYHLRRHNGRSQMKPFYGLRLSSTGSGSADSTPGAWLTLGAALVGSTAGIVIL